MAIQNSYNRTIRNGTQIQLGSDATGDIYYLNASGQLTRLPIGAAGTVLKSVNGLPAWDSSASSYSDENAQDAVGGILNNSSEIELNYSDSTPSITASLVNNGVAFSKVQAIATSRLLGRSTAGIGNIEELTDSQARSLLGLGTAALVNTGTTSGTVPVLDGTNKLPAEVIPNLALTSIQVVANAAARLALTGIQPGDGAKEADTGLTYLLADTDPSNPANWISIGDTSIDAADIVSGTLAPARLGSGTANSTSILFGDSTYKAPSDARTALGLTSLATFAWNEVSGTAATMSANSGYRVTNASLTTLTLPTNAPVDSIIEVVGFGAGGWRIAQGANQQIHFLGLSTTLGSGGRMDSTNRYDCITLHCATANNVWVVKSSMGNIDVI